MEIILSSGHKAGYKFSLGGINFNDYSQIKMLTLDDAAKDGTPKTLHYPGSTDYQVPGDKVFIAFQALVHLTEASIIGRIGESGSANGNITKEVLKFANGTDKPWMTYIVGIFSSDSYVTAETSHNTYTIADGGALYGIEVDK